MTARMLRPAPFVQLAFCAALAAAVAYQLGTWWPTVSPVPAAVTALITTQSTALRAFRMSAIQVLGIVFGAAVALASIQVLGFSAPTIFLTVLASFAIVVAVKKVQGISAPETAASIGVSVIIVIGSHLSSGETFDRFAGVVAGAAIGLVASLFVTSRTGIAHISEEIDDLYASVAGLVSDMSDALAAGDTSDAGEWRERAQEANALWTVANAEAVELDASAKWSPLISSREVYRLQRRLGALGMTINRLVAITADLRAADKQDLFAENGEVLTPLAELFSQVATTLHPGEENVPYQEVSDQVKLTVEQAANADLNTEEFVVVGGLAQNAQRLLPPVKSA